MLSHVGHRVWQAVMGEGASSNTSMKTRYPNDDDSFCSVASEEKIFVLLRTINDGRQLMKKTHLAPLAR